MLEVIEQAKEDEEISDQSYIMFCNFCKALYSNEGRFYRMVRNECDRTYSKYMDEIEREEQIFENTNNQLKVVEQTFNVLTAVLSKNRS